MTPDQLRALGNAFTGYLQLLANCFVHDRTVRHLHGYCHGLLSDLPRKSIEPIALACGTAVRTLQEFLQDHLRVRDQCQQRLAQQPLFQVADSLGTIGVIDETSTAKKGTKTPGVRRQWCGSLGKIENCLVTVHLAIVRGRFKTLVDADLFLPKVWSEDRKRCQDAAIPVFGVDDAHDLVFGRDGICRRANGSAAGGKSGDHFGASLSGVEPTLPNLAKASPGEDG